MSATSPANALPTRHFWLQRWPIGLYGGNAALLAYVTVHEGATAPAFELIFVWVPLLAYAVGMTLGTLRLRAKAGANRAFRWALAGLTLHAALLLPAAAALAVSAMPGSHTGTQTLVEARWTALLVAQGALIAGGPGCFLVARYARFSEALVTTAVAGAGWIVLPLLFAQLFLPMQTF